MMAPQDTPLSRTITGIPCGMRVEDLPQAPNLGSLYLRGAGRSVTAKVPGAADPGPDLPLVAYRARGITSELGQLSRYERLVHERAGNHLPPGYVHILTFSVATAVMTRPDFPVPLLGMVHLANSITVFQPIPLDATLEVTAWAQGARPHRRGTQLDVVAQVRVDSGGEPGHVVWCGVSTYLAKGVFLAGKPGADEQVVSREPEAHGAHGAHGAPHIVWTLGAAVGRAYGAVSGDRNPIHMSGLTARAFGFPRAIAHGMYTAARALADVGPRRGDRFDWTVEFAAPVLLPGRVALTFHTDSSGGVHYEAHHPQTGKPNFTGTVIRHG